VRLAVPIAVLLAAFGTPAAAQEHGEVVEVVIETAKGAITADIYVEAAPVTARNFLAYADGGVFDGGTFFRSVRLDNQPNDSVLIEVIQGGPDRSMRERMRASIPLERTDATGLSHLDGMLSMARSSDPDSGRSQFFVCIGDQPSLDFGGARNADGQGFAAFGRVTSGMDVVRAIQMGAVENQTLVERIQIINIRRAG
jgi:peptidyl-prolyl cis-trans isomerase A (cyclophilin A)